MEKNLEKYLKSVKMSSEFNRLELKANVIHYKKETVMVQETPNLEDLYKKTYEFLNNDQINYKEIISNKML